VITALAPSVPSFALRPRRRAVVLVNIGSPDAPETGPVRRYLAEFLGDGRVLDVPWLVRQLILRLFILPFRPKKSAAAYRTVWTGEGSPLVALSRRQREGLARRLEGDGVSVHLAMRYGQPSFSQVIDELRRQRVEDILLVPMYPQYASATTGSTLEAWWNACSRESWVPSVSVLPPFWNDVAMLDAWAARVRAQVDLAQIDALLFSFHGLPERQVKACDPEGGTEQAHCLVRADCCDSESAPIHLCYRAQCVATARAIAARLGLPSERYHIGFQSRLGRAKWVEPYSDGLFQTLPARGVKRLAVVCPSFTTDCLETLEEVAEQGKEQFLHAGGESFVTVPCLNEDPAFLDALAVRCRARLETGVSP
jgi:ferrochelatase